MTILSAEDPRRLLEDFNLTDNAAMLGYCLPRLLEQAVDSHFDRTALICADTELTYGGLNARANWFARALVELGIGRGDLVGVALDRSVDLVVMLVAVLKSGAAYVPIDPAFPAKRMSQMMEDAAPRLVVANNSALDALESWGGVCLRIDELQRNLNATDDRNLEIEIHAEDLAYVMYTSGSTGRPKGVEVSHGAVSNFVLSMQQEPGCSEEDRMLAISTISFDMAVYELYTPLICGATTVIAQTHQVKDAGALLGLMQHHAITMMLATPTTWQMLLHAGWQGKPRLRVIKSGGESLPSHLSERLVDYSETVWNAYGPTEATGCASLWRVRKREDVLIGSPIANARLYVLDTDLSPVPLGCSGELYIGGTGVACGYHNNPELTRSRFLNNPFHEGLMYRTGDLACFIAPRKLRVLGRADSQVKIRGYRIELGDIEAAITGHEDISKAVVVDHDGRLAAYCVRAPRQVVDADLARRVAEWAAVSDHVYSAKNTNTVFNLAGWRNSYDGLPFFTGEMRDWQMSSVRRILSYSPERVVEIGAGVGLMLFSIAPHCSVYYATDSSIKAVETTRRHIASLPHVVYEHREAHELPKTEGAFDTVIINSVAQYFPSIDYLVSVIGWATNAIDRGRVYLGDLRNMALLEIFHADVINFRGKGQIATPELARRVAHAVRSEQELAISPEFFANLPTMFPRIARVDIMLRNGRYENEMTRYRFDVTLHIGESNDVHVNASEMDWSDHGLDVASLRQQLAMTDGKAQRLNNIPNSRLAAVSGGASDPASSWINPQDLMDIAAELDLEAALQPSRSGGMWCFDAVFWRAGETPDLSLHPPERMCRDTLLSMANTPAVGEAAKASLDSILRPWLAERLPGYMVPAFFTELDDIPLTLNGKTDYKALPDPMLGIKATEKPAMEKPATELGRKILTIWSKILGHDHIGVDDNFFQVGGDSVRLVRVQVELEKLLSRPVSSAKLFEHYTIKTLAKHLVGADMPMPVHRSIVDDDDNNNNNSSSSSSSSNGNEDIAIISMACRLPGGVETPEAFWELLQCGRDAITAVPKERWDADAVYDEDPNARGKSYCRRGGFVTSFDSFDAAFFNVVPREARVLDPAQYVMLETCWEGLERAGYTTQQLRGSETGVFIGVSNSLVHGSSYTHTHELADLDGYTGTGTGGGTMSGRLSYVLGLEGPTLTVDTACSSSLVTTHLACTALRQGECDMAVSGAVAYLPTPGLHVEFSRLRGVSPDGRCRAFAADAQGTGLAEGAAMVALKRLSDAQRDGNTIHGVLRGSAVNHSGRSPGLTVPGGPAQQRLIRTALATSGLLPGDIDYVEAHGTGTKLGDPIEGMALAEVFGGSRSNMAEPLYVGSAKSNIGHTQAPAGLVGLLKVVLAFQHGTLPPTLHATQPTPAVDWQGANMALVQEKRPWLHRDDRLRRAGVSAFGIGGTNAHVVVEEAPRQSVVERTPSAPWSRRVPCLLSGHTDAALRQQVDKLRLHLTRTKTDRLGDIAYSLATSRNHFPQRIVLMAKDTAELLDRLANVRTDAITSPTGPSQGPRLAMLFTGQGSHLPGMGKDLASHYAVFREALDEITGHFMSALDRPLLDVMWASADNETAALLQRTDYAQPALFALEVALWRLWHSWGVQPEFVLGHSVGELAAAHVAGVMDLPDACRLVAARASLMQALPGRGGMMSLQASAADVAAAIETLGLGSTVEIAGLNTPTQTVVSGDVDAIENLGIHFVAQGRTSRTVQVSRAFHSHQMDGMMAAYHDIAETVQFNPPTLGVVSTLTGQLAEPGQLEQPAYWVKQARNAVRFMDGIQTLADQGVNVFLELGPRPVLCGMGAACLADDSKMNSTAWLPSLVPKKDGTAVVQDSLAELHVRHVPIHWSAYFQPFGCSRVELPTYAFQRERVRSAREMEDGGNGAGGTIDALLANRAAQPADRFHFQISWSPVNAERCLPGGKWGFLCPAGEMPWASEVRAALLHADMQLVHVAQLEDAKGLDGLLCLWDSEAPVLHKAHNFTAEALGQLQAAVKTRFTAPVVWVTRNAVGTSTNDQPTGLGAGPLWGLMRTARIEHPELRLRLIDLDDRGAVQNSALARTLALQIEPECAVRQGLVLVPQMLPVQSPALAVDQQLLRRDGAVLITGGVGNIGQSIARWLVRDHGIRDLVLTARRGMDAPGAEGLVGQLSQLGAKATVVASNISDFNSAQAIMAMFDNDRPLRGVVHAAGVLDDGVLTALTPQRCAITFEPKVDGAWHLHGLTQHMDLDLFVMFSSLSGVMGNAGQGNYAAANTFLDALAHLRRAKGLPANSVAWGLWGGNGMGDTLSAMARARYAQFGIGSLAPEDGLHLFEQAVRGDRALDIAAVYDWGRLQSYYESEGRDGIPPLLRSMLSRGRGQAPNASGDSGLRKALSEAGHEQHGAIVLGKVRQTMAKTLGFQSPGDVSVDLPLQDIGVDSLTAILARNQLSAMTNLPLSAKVMFDHQNLKALSQFLVSQLQENDATSTTTVSKCASCLNMAAIRRGCLDSSFTFDNVPQRTTHPESVLVTGATGFVGAFIVHELLKQGIATYCLVRADNVTQAWRRLVDTLDCYGLWQPGYAPLLKALVGDMSKPLLGLAEDVFDDLADLIDAICHSGALVDWMRPMEDYIGPNVISTHEILRLASHGRGKAIHLVSTVATVPLYLGYDVSEDEYEYGYATSKFMAERMVAAARWRGASASVYRVPYVTASSSTGHFRRDRGDFLHNLIAGSIEMGSFPSLDSDLSIVVPVDYLCKTMASVMTQDLSRIGRDFDFTNPQPLRFDQFFKLMVGAGAGQEVVPFSAWRERALAHAAAHPTSPLARIAVVLDGFTEKHAAAMFNAPPVGEHVFGGDDYPMPPVNKQSVCKYLDRISLA